MKKNLIPGFVADPSGRHCYCYIVTILGRPWSLLGLDWWNTKETMITNAASMSATAHIFRPSSAVAVYELGTDDRYYLAHCCNMQNNNRLPASFHRYDVPVSYNGKISK